MTTQEQQDLRIGQSVSYEDMANPRRHGVIRDIARTKWGVFYVVAWEDGSISQTDCRQRGWRLESGPTSTQQTIRYEVCLTPDQFQRLHAVDQEWKGSEHYMGLAYFWNYAYRFELRDATATQRARVHRAFLEAGLALDGESEAHKGIIGRIVKS